MRQSGDGAMTTPHAIEAAARRVRWEVLGTVVERAVFMNARVLRSFEIEPLSSPIRA